MPIVTSDVSLNPAHCEVYSIQHYVIKFVSDLRQVGGFLQFPPPLKLTVVQKSSFSEFICFLELLTVNFGLSKAQQFSFFNCLFTPVNTITSQLHNIEKLSVS
jgi:hypothetical protein